MYNIRKSSLSSGFTLVELLVVIAIIGVLSTLLLLQLGTARSKARDAKRIADVNQIRSGAELYFDDNGQYPDVPSAANFVPKYLSQVPVDPLTADAYGYAYQTVSGKRVGYHIWAEMEFRGTWASSDQDLDSSGAAWTNGTGLAYGKANGAVDTVATCVDKIVAYGSANCIYDQGQQ